MLVHSAVGYFPYHLSPLNFFLSPVEISNYILKLIFLVIQIPPVPDSMFGELSTFVFFYILS